MKALHITLNSITINTLLIEYMYDLCIFYLLIRFVNEIVSIIRSQLCYLRKLSKYIFGYWLFTSMVLTLPNISNRNTQVRAPLLYSSVTKRTESELYKAKTRDWN